MDMDSREGRWFGLKKTESRIEYDLWGNGDEKSGSGIRWSIRNPASSIKLPTLLLSLPQNSADGYFTLVH
jgi:hypothetical protein